MSREGRILLICCRVALQEPEQAQLAQLMAGPLDWEQLVALAAKHRVLPLLHHHLSRCSPTTLPAARMRHLAVRVAAHAARNLRLSQETARLCALLDAAGCTAMAFKGAPMAVTLYGKRSLRQSWDIDVLVPEEARHRAQQVLAAEGYRPRASYDWAQDFVHPVTQVAVDLHWSLTPRVFALHIDTRALLARRMFVAIDGDQIPLAAPEDLLCILCLQAAKDFWERRQHLESLLKVTDIAALLRVMPNLDWPQVTAAARREGWQRILHFGLALAGGLLDAPLPPQVAAAVRADHTAGTLAADVSQRLFSAEDLAGFNLEQASFTLPDRVRQLRFFLSMRERPRDWGWHAVAVGRSVVPQIRKAWSRASAVSPLT
jgi:hypothetical protein